jgi:putative transposase
MAESFMATLKREEVDGRAYRDLADAKALIGQFIETVYNRQRLHSASRCPKLPGWCYSHPRSANQA